MDRTALGDRMKDFEGITQTKLIPKMPTLIRLDGKAFHTLTKKMKKPFDLDFMGVMWDTAIALCEEISGVKVAYVQSDEISLLLADYDRRETQPWFGGKLQKMVSVSAGIASAKFNEFLKLGYLNQAVLPLAVFDSRAWNLPQHEVTNYFIWRQQDCTRNSIQSLAQAHFSHKQLHGKDTSALQDMLMLEKGVNWNDEQTACKRGACVRKEKYIKDVYMQGDVTRTRWAVDTKIPIFTQDREYIEKFVRHGDE